MLERKAPPTFEIAVEIHDLKTWIIHENIEKSVDLLLQGKALPLQKRTLSSIENNIVQCEIVSNLKHATNITESSLKKIKF
jgi:hypothetical protein